MRCFLENRRVRGVALVLLVLFLAPAVAGQGNRQDLPGAEFLGHLEGEESGYALVPARYSGSEPIEILDPAGFQVHLLPLDEMSAEIIHPAGTFFRPPVGRYSTWLQGGWTISPEPRVIVFGSQARGRHPHLQEVGPAGRVVAGEPLGDRSGTELWVLAGPERSGDELPVEFVRRATGNAIRDGLLMPAGTVVAGLRDRTGDRFVALARPFVLPAGREQAAPFEEPDADRTFLVAYVEKPRTVPMGRYLHRALDLSVEQLGEEVPPELRVATVWGVYAFWYGLAPGPAVLRASNAEVYLEEQLVDLPAGSIVEAGGELLERPILDVRLVLPPQLRKDRLELRVRRLPDRQAWAEVTLSPTAGSHRFEGLVQSVLEVELRTSLGSFRREVDLTGKTEESVTLDPEVIELTGTVRVGGEPAAARLELQLVDGQTLDVEADSEGEFSAVALRPVRGLAVRLPEGSSEPWLDFFAPVIRESRSVDVDIPEAEVVLEVVDVATGAAIPEANVAVRNTYSTPLEPGSDEDSLQGGREKVIGQSLRADQEGRVRLPPPRQGRLEIHAMADGYRPLKEPLRVEIEDPSKDRHLEIALVPQGSRVLVRLLLPDGTPASGAEVLRVKDLSGTETLFTGTADGDGRVAIPEAPESGLLLLKHPGGAVAVEDWGVWRSEDRREWTFAPRAPLPLTVRVLGPSGEEPAPGAETALFLGDRRLTGILLQWLTSVRPRTDHNGFWRAEGLPVGPVRVLAWNRSVRDQALAGALNVLSTPIPHPWPGVVELRVVQ